MSLSLYQLRKLRITAYLVAVGVVAGPFYVIFSDGFDHLFPYINSMIGGVMGALFISWVELELLSGKKRFLKFYYVLLIRTGLYGLVIPSMLFLIFVISRMVRYDLSFGGVLSSSEFQNYIYEQDFNVAIAYAIVLSFLASFSYQMSRKMGQGVLLSFMIGRFYHPIKDEKVFMFINLKNSNEVINKVGRFNFHRFLKDVTYHIAPPILIHHGIIHHYVEDEIVIYWDKKSAFKRAHCINTFFSIIGRFETLKEDYLQKYGHTPQFQAALHAGEVIQGEIGELKSEIAFYGDPVNTTSRILGQCQLLQKPFLVSEQIKNNVQLLPDFEWVDCGVLTLKGKDDKTHLYSVKKTALSD
ncbi:adenylate/guanylate cyclase domain-containing protein [Fulvivirgaceae bacterium BMA12]|uniref:Adenylate/guanylate cyclase domain-containing protein n=1 Tax=Agaribacillus aureus TaxID=3051825 RepID=A0ABT8KY66_9BACT|nr:adenylate/guanylate cyclase domain-containing protein [Fulvivirgaceae bacterium BMA12]